MGDAERVTRDATLSIESCIDAGQENKENKENVESAADASDDVETLRGMKRMTMASPGKKKLQKITAMDDTASATMMTCSDFRDKVTVELKARFVRLERAIATETKEPLASIISGTGSVISDYWLELYCILAHLNHSLFHRPNSERPVRRGLGDVLNSLGISGRYQMTDLEDRDLLDMLGWDRYIEKLVELGKRFSLAATFRKKWCGIVGILYDYQMIIYENAMVGENAVAAGLARINEYIHTE